DHTGRPRNEIAPSCGRFHRRAFAGNRRRHRGRFAIRAERAADEHRRYFCWRSAINESGRKGSSCLPAPPTNLTGRETELPKAILDLLTAIEKLAPAPDHLSTGSPSSPHP